MLKKTLAAVLAVTLVLVLAVSASALTYQDTVNHWARAAIDRWSSYGIIVGDAGGFRPDDPMRRDEYSQVLTVLLELTEQSPAGTFVDVPEGHWYTAPSLKAHAAGLMMGDNHRRFAPKNRISREQAIVILARALGLEPDPDPDAVLARFGDAGQVSGWAKPYVAAMVKAGYVAGLTTTTLGPKQNITRASILQLMDATIAYYVDEDDQEINVPKGTAGVVLIVADDATVRAEDDVRIVVAEEDADVSLQGSTAQPTVVATVDGVTIADAPAGTKVEAADGVTDVTVNGIPVEPGQTVVVPGEEEPGTVIPVAPATYTVTFNLNYENATGAPESQTVTSGQTATEPTKPTRENYFFLGWYKEQDGNTPWDFGTDTVGKDTTLYAKWKKGSFTLYAANLCDVDHTIIAGLQEGDDGYVDGSEQQNSAIALNYGLSSEATGSAEASIVVPVPTEAADPVDEQTIYVKFDSVLAHKNGEKTLGFWIGLAGIAPDGAKSFNLGYSSISSADAQSHMSTGDALQINVDPAQKKPGFAQYVKYSPGEASYGAEHPRYIALQWVYDDGTSPVYQFKLVFPDPAGYKLVTYKNGDTDVTTQYVKTNGPIGVLPKEPTREGYTFAGWSTEKNGGACVTKDTTIGENVTLYAQWEVELGILRPAFLRDKEGRSGRISDSHIYTADSYHVMDGETVLDGEGTGTIGEDGMVHVTLTAENLLPIADGSDRVYPWVGLAVKAPEGANKVKYGRYRDTADEGTTALELIYPYATPYDNPERGINIYFAVAGTDKMLSGSRILAGETPVQKAEEYMTIQWCKDDTPLAEPVTYAVSWRGTLAEPLLGTLGTANLGDESGNVEKENLYTAGSYKITDWDGNDVTTGALSDDGTVHIRVNAQQLAYEEAGQGQGFGYWAGVSVQAPEGATKVAYGLNSKTLGAATDNNPEPLEPIGIEGVTQARGGINWWFKVKENGQIDIGEGLDQTFLTIQWLDDDGALGLPVTYAIKWQGTLNTAPGLNAG